MRRRLEELLNETFEYDTPQLLLTGDMPGGEVQEGEHPSGTLFVSHPEGKKVRGYVYSSNPRMACSAQEFYSSKPQIRWQLDLTGLEGGQQTRGSITFCSELGEREVSYVVTVRKDEPSTRVPNVEGLAKLARADQETACDLFFSEDFGKVLEEGRYEDHTLWKALRDESVREHALEEFLIGTGQKEPIELSLSAETRKVENPEGTVLEQVTVTKSTWGYLELEISSDARFLRVEKKKVTTDDFIGSRWELRYIIDSNFLHAGRNWGRITIRTCYQTLTYEVCAQVNSGMDLRSHRVQNLMCRKAVQLYLDYRMGRLELKQWAERTQSVIGSYKRSGGTDIRADLLSVFVMQAEGKRSSSERELRRIERMQDVLGNPEAEASWLYLSTFFSRDQDYINQVRGRLRVLHLENRSSWLIQWLAFYLLEDEMGGDSGKLELIIRHIEHFSASPVLLMEAVQIVLKNPFLLHDWTNGARMVVSYAVKEGITDEKLVLHSMNLIRRRNRFDHATFRMLARCYENTRLDDVLAVWTQMAILGEKKDEKYFSLYQAAVARDLRITGLYEYYMETMGEVRIEQMPQVIRRFFVMNDSLDWRKKARIYRNMSDSADSIPQIFAAMRPSVEKFITDQIQMMRINEDLAVLTSRYLNRQMITVSLARKLIRLLFTFEIDCRNPLMKKVVVADTRLSRVRTVPITDHKAQIQIYSEQSRIFLEDEEGHRYASTSLYMAQHLLDDARLLNLCVQEAVDDPHLVLFFALNPKTQQPITHQALRFFVDAERQAGFSEDYRTQLRTWLLDYYDTHTSEETMGSFLREIDTDTYVRIDRKKLLALLTQEGMYETAWPVIEKYGTEGIDLNLVVRILSQTVLDRDYEEDRVLLAFCASVFESGKVEEHLLSYLLMYYDGPVGKMKELWRLGHEYGLDTMAAEKKILSLIVFTRQGSVGSEPIYVSYRRALGSRRLSRGYVILRCYEYLVKELPVSDVIFEDCLREYLKGSRLPDVCGLALLQYLSGIVQLDGDQKRAAGELLSYYCSRGIRFAYFQRFPQELISGLGIDDKVFCEAVADPRSSVRLLYRFKHENNPFVEETMRDVFEGIRVREFVLFEGEELECYTVEQKADGKTVTSPHRYLKAGAVPDALEDSRYGRIMKMAKLLSDGDQAGFEEALKEYRQLDSLTREIFTLL